MTLLLRHHLLAAAATTALVTAGIHPVLAQGSGVQVLVEQANFWRGQGQPARAVAALERALAAQPSHPDVLAAAAAAQADLGQARVAQGYLERLRAAAPGDARIASLEASLRAAAAATPTTAEQRSGLSALELGDPARAAQAFEAALARNPEDPAALGGLGAARLRQGRVAEARDLLLRAAAAGPEEAKRWAEPLEDASFRVELAEARRRIALGAPDAAEILLLRATRRGVAERAEAEALLGELALRRDERPQAEASFREAAFRRPALPSARAGLLEVLRRQGRFAEADGLAREIASSGTGQADALRAEAARTEDPEAALILLRKAVLAAPESPWPRLDLARALRRQGQGAEGRAVMEELPQAASGAEAAQAVALYAQAEGRFADAIRVLDRVPDRLRGADHARLARSLRWQADIAAGMTQDPSGRRGALLAIAGRVDPTGEAALRAVRALLRAGDREGTETAIRLALGANRGTDPALRLSLAGALADGGMDQAASELLKPLATADLPPTQRRQFAALGGVTDPVRVAAAAPRPVEAEPPRLYQGARDPRVAGRIAEAVLRRDPRNAEARIGAIEAALVQQDVSGAEMLLAEGRVLNATDPRLSFLEAQLARTTGDVPRARTALRLAADQRRSQVGSSGGTVLASAGPGATPYRRTMLAGEAVGDGQGSSFVPLDSNPSSAAQGGVTPGVTPSQLRASDDPLLSEIGRQLAEVDNQASGRIVPNFTFRDRAGQRGLERLREYGGGVEAATPLPTVGGELAARVQSVTLDSSTLGTSDASLRQFGTNAIALGTNPNLTADQRAALRPRDGAVTGVALGAAYTRSGVTVDIGSTPLGFREQNILGGVEITPRLSENWQLRLRGERRSVTDSILAWSGLRDAQTGISFGGVVRNTGRAQIEYFKDRWSGYAGAGYSGIDGHNVAGNSRIEAGAGVSYAILRNQNHELLTGLDLTYFAYDKNLRYFTLGQGGYFSPQNYFGAAIPIDWRQRIGNWAYRVGGSLGFAHFNEKGSPYYPTNAAYQSQLETLAASDSTVAAYYTGQRRTSVTGGVRADIEYALTPTLRVGASARHDRTADFDETRALIYARYRFDP